MEESKESLTTQRVDHLRETTTKNILNISLIQGLPPPRVLKITNYFVINFKEQKIKE